MKGLKMNMGRDYGDGSCGGRHENSWESIVLIF